MTSCLTNLPVRIRNEGRPAEEEFLGDRFETEEQLAEAREKRLPGADKAEIGDLIILPHPLHQGAILPQNWRPPRDAEGAWPEDAHIRVRARIRHGDTIAVDQMLTSFRQQYLASHPEDEEGKFYIPPFSRAQLWVALLLVGFESPDSGFFEDPRTMKGYDDDPDKSDPQPGTGEVLKVPRDESGAKDLHLTLDLIRDVLPRAITDYTYNRIEELSLAPLDGLQPHASETVKTPKKTSRKAAA